MKLDRNGLGGVGKYALVNLRKLTEMQLSGADMSGVSEALDILLGKGLLEMGSPGSKDEFFVLKLKDLNSTSALRAYARTARISDAEFSDEVMELAARSGSNHPHCKLPD